jgi:hypothetical protein
MKIVYLVALLLTATAFALTMTEAEYYVNTDPGAGNGTDIPIGADSLVNISGLFVPTTGLQADVSHRLFVRYRSVEGLWGTKEARNFFIFAPDGPADQTRNVVSIEYWFDNLTPVAVDIPDGYNGSYAAFLPSSGLSVNTAHKFSIRYFDNTGKVSQPEARYFFIHEPTGSSYGIRRITDIEYKLDNATPVLVDLADATFESWTDLIPTAGLTVQTAHKLSVRYLDDRGLWSQGEARYFFLHQPLAGTRTIHEITHAEVWFDTLTHSLLDIADAVLVNYADSIPHNLSAGPHFFRLRYHDERGLLSQTESRPFFVWTGAGPGGNARLAGAEYFVNVDPGVGNGVPINFPQDGTWDERNETALTILTGIPTGLHLFGIRFKDELGEWSITLADSFVVGPVLVIKPQGNDIVLSWIANPDHTPFRIYRADTFGGTFTQIGTSNTLSYTDVNRAASALRSYYHLTVELTALSGFRLPAGDERPQRD